MPPPPLRLLPGGAIQFPGGFISRCGPAPFHGALLWPDYKPNAIVADESCAATDLEHLAHRVMLGGGRKPDRLMNVSKV